MYICYVDESGHCGKKHDPNQPVEVLCGVVTDVTKLNKTRLQQRRILELLRKNGIPARELKAREAYGGRGAWDKVKPGSRDRIYGWVLEWMERRDCKLIVCPVDSERFFKLKEQGCQLSRLLKFPYEAAALNVVLAVQRAQRTKKKNKGNTVLIFDEQPSHYENVLRFFEEDLAFTDGYTRYTPRPRAREQPARLDQIVDAPHFSKSHLAIPIQLADWAAFVVNRHIQIKCFGDSQRYNGEGNKIRGWYERIGNCLLPHTVMDPPGSDRLCQYYRDIRPRGWSAKQWLV